MLDIYKNERDFVQFLYRILYIFFEELHYSKKKEESYE